MAKLNKVLYNIDQTGDTSAAEKRTARNNIGCPSIITSTNTLPPVETAINTLTFKTDSRVYADNNVIGNIAPNPGQTDAGKFLVAQWAGSPAIGTYALAAINQVPVSTISNAGQVLTVNDNGFPVWQTPTSGSSSNKGVYEFTVIKVLDGTDTKLWSGDGLTSADIRETFVNCTAETCPVRITLNSYGGLSTTLLSGYNSITCESHTYVSQNANFATELGMWGFDELCQVVAGMNRTWYLEHNSPLDRNGILSTTSTMKYGTLTIKFDFVFEV